MIKRDLIFASFMMLIAVVLGAFGAHLLKDLLDFSQLESYKTGIRYQFIHALSIFIIASNSFDWLKKRKRILFFFKLGIILFSFSIYGLTICNVLGNETFKSILGPITPLGGLLLIVAWVLLIIQLFKTKILK